MSETPEAPREPDTPVASAPPSEPVLRPSRRGRRVAAVTGSLLLAGAVVAGVAFTAVTVDGADRDPGAASWKFPAAGSPGAGEKPATGLSGLLLPYDEDGRQRGPDVAELGPDAQPRGARATALRKETLPGLPRAQLKRLEKEVDRQRVTGMAIRSYASGSASLYQSDDIYTARIVLARMESQAVARDQAKLLGSLDALRSGPAIQGHPEAACFLSPKGKDEVLDSMFCSASVGNVLVTVTADGVAPLDSAGVAALVREQLDRIDELGKTV
ncbi:hypothetical protein ACIRPR_16045 [Streptomyces griseoflavus]|uniref:hypothetical protein n=1 Tax=Streptomyces griseoflavus TaxID=35619 RepID=UPI00380EB58B